MVVPAVAQPQESCECMYAPKKGQFQVNLGFGQGQFFNDFNGLYYLLPNADGTSLGLGFLPANYKEVAGLGNNYISADLSTYAINIGSLNLNDLTNIAGVQAKYFLTNHIDINLSAAYNVNLQPHKDYIEGEYYGLGELKEMLNGILAAHSGKKIEDVVRDTDRDHFMSAEEACAWGLIDKVLEPKVG